MDEQVDREKRIEAATRITAALYDKAAAYTNLVIIAGYAAFFAVWGNIKDNYQKGNAICRSVHDNLNNMLCPMGNHKDDNNHSVAEEYTIDSPWSTTRTL
jgi:hypothetical protein